MNKIIYVSNNGQFMTIVGDFICPQYFNQFEKVREQQNIEVTLVGF